MIEVAVASVITMVSLIFLATLFTLAMSQNRLTKQHTSTTELAQKKLEELMAIEGNDARLAVGGGLGSSTQQTGYFDQVYVDDSSGLITTTIPTGKVANYGRYWQIEADPGGLARTVMISVKVVALQTAMHWQNSEQNNEQTTLTTVRSF